MLVLVLFILAKISNSARLTFTWSQSFTSGVSSTKTGTQCTSLKTFISNMPSNNVESIRVYGSNQQTGYSCNDIAKNTQIINYLKNEQIGSVQCNGYYWHAGDCSTNDDYAAELKVDSDVSEYCRCLTKSSNLFIARPCIGNNNWGGLNTATCTPPSQTLSIRYVYS